MTRAQGGFDSLVRVILVVITCVWVANFVAQFVPNLNYRSDPVINGIFATTCGALVGAEIKRSLQRRDRGQRPTDVGGTDD